MTTPSVDEKLDMLMEAILKQQELLKQVLLGFDSILKQVLVVKDKSTIIKQDKKIVI